MGLLISGWKQIAVRHVVPLQEGLHVLTESLPLAVSLGGGFAGRSVVVVVQRNRLEIVGIGDVEPLHNFAFRDSRLPQEH